jgi:hypothetical protein
MNSARGELRVLVTDRRLTDQDAVADVTDAEIGQQRRDRREVVDVRGAVGAEVDVDPDRVDECVGAARHLVLERSQVARGARCRGRGASTATAPREQRRRAEKRGEQECLDLSAQHEQNHRPPQQLPRAGSSIVVSERAATT